MSSAFNPYGALRRPDGPPSDTAGEGLTCMRCLRGDHVLCHEPWEGGCACGNCRAKRRREVRAELAEERGPRPARTPRVVAERRHVDLPPEVTERHGRYMTDEQVRYAHIMRASGYTLKEIGAALGGFDHSSVHVTLRRTAPESALATT